MSYQDIEKILSSDASFVGRLAVKDVDVTSRSGQHTNVSALVYQVGEALKKAGFELQNAPKTYILAIAASIPVSACGPVTVVPQAAPDSTPKEQSTLLPEPPRKISKPSSPRTVVVKGAKASAIPPVKPIGDPVAQFIDSGTIHRYQVAIACAQLLAALSQLFEKDDWPGCDERRKKLDDLITDVEKSSTQHVNLSVKQIIRAQATQKAERED